MSSESAQGEARTDAVAVRRERLRFTGFSLVRSPSGRVTCEVTLEWAPGEAILGRAEGQASPAGDARLQIIDWLYMWCRERDSNPHGLAATSS